MATPENADTVAKMLETHPIELDLSHLVCEAELLILAKALEMNSSLEKLNLSWNQVSDAGAQALGKALEVNKTLKELYLSFNEICDQGAIALGKALSVNKTLTHLHLPCNKINELGAAALAKALETNKTLKTLVLIGNNIGDTGATALARSTFLFNTTCKLYIVEGSKKKSNKILDAAINKWRVFILSSATQGTCFDMFERDGDHAIATRVLEFL